MKISQLINKLELSKMDYKNHSINKISDCSTKIKENDVFFAFKGFRRNGHDYIDEAIKMGAKTIFYDETIEEFKENVNYFYVNNSKKTYAQALKIFHRDISKKVYIIGVTGTNGKTTITSILHNYLEYEGKKSMLIGTNGIIYGKNIIETNNTTPGVDVLYEYLKIALKEKIKYIVMEVSSISIAELRVYGIDFNALIMSNLTMDHLDYHQTMERYFLDKSIIFSRNKDKKRNVVVLNKDIPYYKKLSDITCCKEITYGINNKADVRANCISTNIHGTNFKLIINNVKYSVKTYFIGDFNVYNLLSCVALISFLKFDVQHFLNFLKLYNHVEGRMDIFTRNNKQIIIDYAHTPDGVLQVLKTLRPMTTGNLIVVMGCGGDKDKQKRPIIGQILSNYCDTIVVTNDNPRDEDEDKIIQDIISNMDKEPLIIKNRYDAIKHAILMMQPFDILAILGKGHEQFQIIKGEKIAFSDYRVVLELIGG